MHSGTKISADTTTWCNFCQRPLTDEEAQDSEVNGEIFTTCGVCAEKLRTRRSSGPPEDCHCPDEPCLRHVETGAY